MTTAMGPTFAGWLAQAESAVASAGHDNDQLQLILQGWIAIAMLAAIGALGIGLIVVLLAVWRRSLAREQRLEQEIREVRSRLAALGDAWAASATRIPGFQPRPPEPEADDDPDDDEEDEEEDDPYNLFGGHDPLDRDPDDDEDEDDDPPPPGY